MRETDTYLSKTLLVSAAVSLSACFISVVLAAVTGWSQYSYAAPVTELIIGLKSFNPLSFAAFGVLLVIASPFAWVSAVIVSFVTGKRFFYSFLGVLVLLLMLLSVVVATA